MVTCFLISLTPYDGAGLVDRYGIGHDSILVGDVAEPASFLGRVFPVAEQSHLFRVCCTKLK